MKRSLLSIISCLLAFGVYAQTGSPDSGVFLLHKFQQHIGKETYHVSKSKDSVVYKDDFKFVDRGSPVPLKTSLRLTPALDPLGLDIKGNVARGATVNDHISINGGTARIKVDDSVYDKKIKPATFPIAGYAPTIVQEMLVQYWIRHHEPASINILPTGSVQIRHDGNDTLRFNNKPLILKRYTIAGLIWGNEFLWTNRQGQVVAIITNDAEFDKFETVREAYESLLPGLIGKTATYSMHLFTRSAGLGSRPEKLIAITGGTVYDVVNEKPMLMR